MKLSMKKYIANAIIYLSVGLAIGFALAVVVTALYNAGLVPSIIAVVGIGWLTAWIWAMGVKGEDYER